MNDFDFAQIDAIINARSIAIVGASNTPGKFGSLLPASQAAMGFTGVTYLVNPREKEIMGQPAYPDLASLPEVPDLVIITIPAHRSMEALRDCARAGVKGVIILAAGFREAGEQGAALEAEAAELARQGGFRIIGPNCFGIYNPRNRLTMLPGYDFSTVAGDIAFIAQSGGFAVQVARLGKSLDMHFSAVISYGNGGDVDETDLLSYFARDPQTRVIGGYLEGACDGRAFLDALEEAAAAKPVVLWKVGKAEPSRRAVASHTGSLAGSAEIWDAAIRQAGAIPASGVDEVMDIFLALKHLGRHPGRRILTAGGGGGLGTFAADIAEEEGLEVPLLGEETLARMGKVLGRAGAVPGNPLDIGAPLIPFDQFEGTMREAAADPGTDILVFEMPLNFAYDLAGEAGLQMAADMLIGARRDTGKPLVIVLYSVNCDTGDGLILERIYRELRDKFLAAGVPVYPSMPRALRAIARIN